MNMSMESSYRNAPRFDAYIKRLSDWDEKEEATLAKSTQIWRPAASQKVARVILTFDDFGFPKSTKFAKGFHHGSKSKFWTPINIFKY